MIKHGIEPFLECSSRGDKRFSAYFARIKSRGNNSIEVIYQGAKILDNGTTGNSPSIARNKPAKNAAECKELYSKLWDEYLKENPDLIPILIKQTGLSDLFGKDGHCCQATELWRIRGEELEKQK